MTDSELLAEFQRRFLADPDPWSFETSEYERRKRAVTLEACGPLADSSVLELGAGNGVLAAELGAQSAMLVAIEAVPAAAHLARDRLQPIPGAELVEGVVPGAVPNRSFDVVVASEILYYLDESSYRRTLERLPSWMARGGRLVAVHWRPTSSERPRSAADVHRDLAEHQALQLSGEHHEEEFLLSVLRLSTDPHA